MSNHEEDPVRDGSPAQANINLFAALRILRSAGSALFAQAALHEQLARVEWAEEKSRLLQMLVAILLGFIFLMCGLIVISGALLALSWSTPYRLPVVFGLVAFFVIALVIVWRRFQTLAARGDQSFAATREELAADIALIKSHL